MGTPPNGPPATCLFTKPRYSVDNAACGVPVYFSVAAYFRQTLQRYAKLGACGRMPCSCVEVHQRRAAGVGDIGHIHATLDAACTRMCLLQNATYSRTCQHKHEPCVNGAKPTRPPCHCLCHCRHMVQHPAHLVRAKVCADWQTSDVSQAILVERLRASLVVERAQRTGPPCCSWNFVHVTAVRTSIHTIALCSGCPVVASHANVVSRWLVMPTALTCTAPRFCAASIQP